MSLVICHREQCKFKDSSSCCIKDYVILNAVGVCSEWYDTKGNPRPIPFYEEMGEDYPPTKQPVNIYIDAEEGIDEPVEETEDPETSEENEVPAQKEEE